MKSINEEYNRSAFSKRTPKEFVKVKISCNPMPKKLNLSVRISPTVVKVKVRKG